ncbi:MAG: hypothetical protein AAGH45_12640 [Pseudomonadota bacterium]
MPKIESALSTPQDSETVQPPAEAAKTQTAGAEEPGPHAAEAGPDEGADQAPDAAQNEPSGPQPQSPAAAIGDAVSEAVPAEPRTETDADADDAQAASSTSEDPEATGEASSQDTSVAAAQVTSVDALLAGGLDLTEATKRPQDGASRRWTVRGIPTDVRSVVSQAAEDRGITIGEWLSEAIVRYAADAADAGTLPQALDGLDTDRQAAAPDALLPPGPSEQDKTERGLDAPGETPASPPPATPAAGAHAPEAGPLADAAEAAGVADMADDESRVDTDKIDPAALEDTVHMVRTIAETMNAMNKMAEASRTEVMSVARSMITLVKHMDERIQRLEDDRDLSAHPAETPKPKGLLSGIVGRGDRQPPR